MSHPPATDRGRSYNEGEDRLPQAARLPGLGLSSGSRRNDRGCIGIRRRRRESPHSCVNEAKTAVPTATRYPRAQVRRSRLASVPVELTTARTSIGPVRGAPVRAIIDRAWGYSSTGRARRSQCRGWGFESPYLHSRRLEPVTRVVQTTKPKLEDGASYRTRRPTQLDKIKNLYVAVRTGTLKVSAIPLIPSFRPIYRQCSGARPGGLSPL